MPMQSIACTCCSVILLKKQQKFAPGSLPDKTYNLDGITANTTDEIEEYYAHLAVPHGWESPKLNSLIIVDIRQRELRAAKITLRLKTAVG